jgi:Zn-dependent protease
MPSHQGSIRLFRLAGVTVFLHWSWFLVAVFEVNSRAGKYSSIAWNVAEYLALFLIVLLHEYGHALACQQVGGNANQIVLWPLGGVAYVDPPQRPGAVLWSIAAGPLVNVALFPILFVLVMTSTALGWAQTMPNAHKLVLAVLFIDGGLLIFNMLPVYPLDGGQVFRALLWFVMGRARSLLVAALIGFAGVAGLIVLAFRISSAWFFILSLFILLNCWGGLKQSVALLRLAKLPQHDAFTCPWCKASPPRGNYWTCGQCRTIFDPFEMRAVCPHCAGQFPVIRCPNCGRLHPLSEWRVPAFVAQKA